VREVLQPVDGRDVVLQLADRQLVVDGAGVNPGHFGDRYLAKIIRFRFQALFGIDLKILKSLRYLEKRG